MGKNNKSGKIVPEQPETEGHSAKIVVNSNEEYNKNLKKRLEEKNNSKLIKYEELINVAPEFANWLKEIVRYDNVDSQALIFWDVNQEDGSNHFIVRLYTNNHCYSICGYTPTEKNPKGYLGCTATTRKPRVGEDWNRGNDLPDGEYCKETFDDIVYGIVAYELKNLQLWK